MPAYTRSEGCPTHNFSVCICRNQEGKYLAVNETRDRGWWVPAGWVDPGEDLKDAAKRETLEEAGIDVRIKGILRIEHSHRTTSARLRVVFYAEPVDEGQAPKSVADSESLEARWVTVDEFSKLGKLRGSELMDWGNYIDKGGPIFPVWLLQTEGMPAVVPRMKKTEDILVTPTGAGGGSASAEGTSAMSADP